MSFSKIKIMDYSNSLLLPSFNDGDIVAVCDINKHKFIYKEEDRILTKFNDQNIGIVYTDCLIKSNDYEYIEYLDGIQIYDIPFFMKYSKSIKFNIDNKSIGKSIINSILQHGFYFEHIAEPLTIINIQ